MADGDFHGAMLRVRIILGNETAFNFMHGLHLKLVCSERSKLESLFYRLFQSMGSCILVSGREVKV